MATTRVPQVFNEDLIRIRRNRYIIKLPWEQLLTSEILREQFNIQF